MSLPFLVPLLVGGALLGANVARNKDENILEGALKGALLGGGASTLGSALGFGSATPTAMKDAGTKLLATAKDKPLETAQFATMVGSALSPPPAGGGGAVPPFSPGSVQPTPTVDESIGEMPMFVPKPLFDDMMGRSPEEMMLLEQQMMQRGLV